MTAQGHTNAEVERAIDAEVIGNEKAFDRPLSSIGSVAAVDVAIPTAVK